MKKLLLVVCMLLFSTVIFAQLDIIIDYAYTYAISGSGTISGGAYNPATGHFLACDYDNDTIHIIDPAGSGSVVGTLSTTGYVAGSGTGTYDFFCVGVADDGTIYACSQTGGTTGSEVRELVTWANESATPSQQVVAGMNFPRAMAVTGSGGNTVIGVTGSDDYNVTFLTTTDGTTFTVTDSTPVGGVTLQTDGTTAYDFGLIKQGVSLSPDMLKVFGTKQDGVGEIARLDYDGGTTSWIAHDAFSPPLRDSTAGTDYFLPSPIGYSPDKDVLFVLGCNADDVLLVVIDADTGTEIDRMASGANIANYGYGAINVVDASEEAYFIARTGNAGLAVAGSVELGKITFTYPTKAKPWTVYE